MRNKIILIGASVASISVAGSGAMAQEPSDIIVTARRVEERLQDVPISITVFNQQQLSNRNVVNAGDLATYTPSLSANGRFGAENTSFAIRGFVQDPGTAPSVAVYFADVATLRAAGGTTLGNGSGPGAYFDLANVQVLKGAQGTLFGRNTTGGAVLLVPQKPTGRFEGYVEASVGNYDMRRIQAVVNVPVADTFRVRLGVDRQTRRGVLNNYSGIGPRDFADTDYWAVRASVVADLTPNLENYLVASWSDSDTSGFLPQVFTCAPGALRPVDTAAVYQANLACAQVARQNARGDFYGVENAAPAPRQHTQQWQVINTTTWKASDSLTIKIIASYGEFREYFRSAVYGENLVIPAGAGPNAGLSLLKVLSAPLNGQNSAAESTFTEEIQFQGEALGGRLNWQAGGYTEQSEPLGFSGAASVGSAVCGSVTDNLQCAQTGIPSATLGGGTITSIINQRINKQRFQNYGTYGQATYKLSDQFSFTGGLRYTWDATTSVTRQGVYRLGATFGSTPTLGCLAGTAAGTCEAQFHVSSSAPTWLLDIDFKPAEDILLYAKYTRGYRAAGVKVDGGLDFNTFLPEKVDTYETGFKTSFRGAVRGTFNVSAYYSKFLSEQLAGRLDPTPANPSQQSAQTIISGNRSRIYGVEVEASVSPFRGFSIDGNYAYLNSKLQSLGAGIGSSTLYFPPIPSVTALGYPLGYAPRNKFTITGSYTLPLDESIGRITASATFSHSDSQLTTSGYIAPVAVNNATIPANLYGYNVGQIAAINLLNANLNWANVGGRPVDLSLFVTNLTKQKYATSIFGGIGAFGFDSRTLGEPRMFGARLKYRFGS